MITVVVADDHVATRAGVRLALHGRGFSVVAEAATAQDAVREALEHRPDVCLLDVNMPGGGIAAAEQIAERLPETKVVMLTVSGSEEDVLAALRAGASGYLLKDTPATRLPAALRGVVEGEAALPRALVTRLIVAFREGEATDLELHGRGARLTRRERDVLELLQRGLDTRTIAQRLSISPVTVRSHVSGILRKLGAEDREAALRLLGGR